MSQYQQTPPTQSDAGQQVSIPDADRSQLYATESPLPQDVRVEMVQRLNGTLADATILTTHAKFAHWNVKGMAFVGLHDLFDDVAEDVEDHVDEIAERITALGGQALGTAGQAVTNCRLPALPTQAVSGVELVELLAERLAIHDANLQREIEFATQRQDLDTADLLNEISREVSEKLWFLEAHLQHQPISSVEIPAGTHGAAQSRQPQEVGSQQAAAPGAAPQAGTPGAAPQANAQPQIEAQQTGQAAGAMATQPQGVQGQQASIGSQEPEQSVGYEETATGTEGPGLSVNQ